MERVSFITTESGTDLIVAFAIHDEEWLGEVRSLILHRTPEYEIFLYEWERGVSVSDEAVPEEGDRPELLEIMELGAETARVVTDRQEYALDLSKVDPEEVGAAEEVLRKMNFDERFELRIGWGGGSPPASRAPDDRPT